MEPIDHLTRDAAHRLGEGIPSAQVARQRGQVDWMYRKLQARSDLRRWWAVPAALAVMCALVWFTRVVPADRQQALQMSSRQTEFAGSALPTSASASEPRAPSQAVPSYTLRAALPDHEPLIAKVAAQSVSAGSALHAGPTASTLEFSDQSQITLDPETDALLAQLDARSVRVDLEQGRLDLSVTPGGTRAWIVGAGPYTVEVTGTVFAVTWNPREQSLAVGVTAGSVLVRGNETGDTGRRLSAGQEQHFGNALPSGPTRKAAKTVTPKPRSTWRELAELGHHDDALLAAQREGFAALLDQLGADDLDRLAHSARLARAAAPARAALEALRRRFPADGTAKKAAFLLGRVAIELARDTKAAAGWFETYLHEQPSGALAEEARARLMELWNDGHDMTRAQDVARDYLRYHSNGEHSGLARRILAAR